MGEYVDIGNYSAGSGLFSAFLSLIALALYAFIQEDAGNDDDDSDGNGGLMEPIT